MTMLVRQRTPRHKQRTVVTGSDPVQVMLMIVAALAVTTLMALDLFFS
jgi:ribosomal protein S15P/S13E